MLSSAQIQEINTVLQDTSSMAVQVLEESLKKELLLDYDPESIWGDPEVCRLQKETVGNLRTSLLRACWSSTGASEFGDTVQHSRVSAIHREALSKVDHIETVLDTFRRAVWDADSQIDLLYIRERDNILMTLGELYRIVMTMG